MGGWKTAKTRWDKKPWGGKRQKPGGIKNRVGEGTQRFASGKEHKDGSMTTNLQ